MNLLDYLATEFATFDEKPFNPIDSVALSQFCMVRAEGIVPALHERKTFLNIGSTVENLFSPARHAIRFTDALRAERYATMFTGLVPDLIKKNLLALAASPRFRDITIRDYLSLLDTRRQTQFAATTFVYKKEFAYVGFRGTDNSFTGWKENFNMAYTAPVPAQEQAARYVDIVGPRLPKRLFIGGHSKGGNLAVYAALRTDPNVRKRIERVYNHDGPGFKPGTFSEDDWASLENRVHRTVPQESIIGMLMESRVVPHVVKSSEHGIMQHNPFSWEIGDDDFVYLDDISDSARFTEGVLAEWLAAFTDEERAVIVAAIFEALETSGAQNVTDLLSGGVKTIAIIAEAAKCADKETRDILLATLKKLTSIAMRNATENMTTRLGPPNGISTDKAKDTGADR